MSLSYASLAEIKSEVKTDKTVDDAIVINYGRQASQRIDRLFQSRRPFFFPYIETRYIPMSGMNINSSENTFDVGQNLLELTTLVAGTTTITAIEVWPPHDSPGRKLRLTGDCPYSWYYYQNCSGCSSPLVATIAGVWGFHRDYANAWLSVDALTAAITTTTATTFTVSTISNFSPGQLIKIDSEYMEVTAASVLTVTVKRGVNGSTAATHLINAAIYIWQVEEPIKRAVSRQAAFMYQRRGAYETSQINDLGTIQFPADMLAEVYGCVQGYAYS